jgi:uncharacterized repeat protein (TIGR03803 family)
MNGQSSHRSLAFPCETRGRAARCALVSAITFALAVLATAEAQAQAYSENVLYVFNGGAVQSSEESPGSLLRDAEGNFYGVAEGGAYPDGMLWKLDTSGNLTVLHAFTGTGGDGDGPNAGLVRDAKGNLYGTTAFGGNLTCNASVGCGIVFKVDPAGSETILHTFTGTNGDGAEPAVGLTMDPQGNLYGTTAFAGNLSCDAPYGCGTVFEIDTAGSETVLYSFTGTGGDGEDPQGTVLYVQGNLYGTTAFGGNLSCPYFENLGCGTVFELDTSGNEAVLYTFPGTAGDGVVPSGSLARDKQGNLYGTTTLGGDLSCPLNHAGDGCGTVFKLDTSGNETVLYSFTGANGDGARPDGVVRDAKGNLYGVTGEGGVACDYYDNGCGIVFEVSNAGKESTLYTFTGNGPSGNGTGAFPNWILAPDAQGNLYGTASIGGQISPNCGDFVDDIGCGIVFELSPPPATATTLTSSTDPSTYGQTVTFTAVVTSSAGSPPDGETVSFMIGKTLLGTGELSGGSASLTTSSLPVGSRIIRAVYAGDSTFAGSASRAVKQMVGQATTTTVLASSLNPSTVGQWVTFTATVTPEISGTPTGRVDFYDGTTLLRSVALSLGEAEFTTAGLTSGPHTITVAYTGDAEFTASSTALTQTVN